MTAWNIYQLMTWLDKCVDRTQTQMLIEIRNIINDAVSSGRYQYNWLDKVWYENCEYTINLKFSFELTYFNQNTFIIWDGNLNNKLWKVMCVCGLFLSSKVFIICVYVI